MHKSETIKKIDPSIFDFTDIEFDSLSEVELTTDMGELIMKNQTNETFDELLKRNPYKTGNLFVLSRIRLMLHDNGILNLINTYKGTIDNSYLVRMEILLNKAGFIHLEVKKASSPLIIRAIRRPVETEDLGYGLILKEIIRPDEILLCHQFAKDYYYYKDFNYDMDVVKQFDLNCDHYAVYDENGEIYSMSRIITRTPGHCCPFMYATIAGETGNKHITIPGEDKRIGEIMAIYSAGKKGVVAFKRMMEYGATIVQFDSLWTTYDDADEYTGMYYKNKFIMEDTGIKLIYSDFGGTWNLLVTDRIAELKDRHNQIFKQKKE